MDEKMHSAWYTLLYSMHTYTNKVKFTFNFNFTLFFFYS